MILNVLATQNYRLLSVAALIDVFETVNRFSIQDCSEPCFTIQFIGFHPEVISQTPFATYPFKSPEEIEGGNQLIFVPAFSSAPMEQSLQANMNLIPFLIQQHMSGSTLVSLCTGSFLLAAGGLLNGKEATTHIEAVEPFKHLFPDVKLLPHAVVTQSGNIYTSGGATSSFHMKLMQIQKYCGREMAIRVAKNFAIDMDRNTQLYFDRFVPTLSPEDELVRSVQKAINERFSELKNVEEAFEQVPSSRRNIIRRFKSATGMTPIKYLQKTKIEAAKKLLVTTNRDINDIMWSSGYNDIKNFRQLFKLFTGLTPTGYREKYSLANV